jgi:molybdopterin converting factor small subunit
MPTGVRGTVRVRLFARYAELAGRDALTLAITLPTTVGELIRRLREELPGGQSLPEHPLAAVNLQHVKLDRPLADGDEVALLPPLAGG